MDRGQVEWRLVKDSWREEVGGGAGMRSGAMNERGRNAGRNW